MKECQVALCMSAHRTSHISFCSPQSFILLHEALSVLPTLVSALSGARCELLRTVAASAGHAAFPELATELEAVLEEDVASAKNTFLNRRASHVPAGA